MTLQDLLKKTVEEDASDLHITVGSPPRIRKGGKLIPISDSKLTEDETKSLITSDINDQNKSKLESGSEIDFSISWHPTQSRLASALPGPSGSCP